MGSVKECELSGKRLRSGWLGIFTILILICAVCPCAADDLWQEATALEQKRDFVGALEVYRAIRAQEDIPVSSAIRAQLKIGDALIYTEGWKASTAAYESLITEFSSIDDPLARDYVGRAYHRIVGDISNAGEYEAAIKAADRALEYQYSPGHLRASVLIRRAICHARIGDKSEALDDAIGALEAFAQGPASGALPGVIAELERFYEALGDSPPADFTKRLYPALRRIVVSDPSEAQIAEFGQLVLVELMLENGDIEAATYEAKILVEVASSSEVLERGVEALTKALKAQDGSLHRLNMFLDYQRQGRIGPDGKLGTDDDLIDPLADIAPSDSTERDAVF